MAHERVSGERPKTVRMSVPATPAPVDTARHWYGGNYLGAPPPASARQDLARGGWGSRQGTDEGRDRQGERCRRDA